MMRKGVLDEEDDGNEEESKRRKGRMGWEEQKENRTEDRSEEGRV